jgi:hypothetical protein
MSPDAIKRSEELAKELKSFLDSIRLKPQCITCSNFHTKEKGEEVVCQTCERFSNYTTR